MFRTVGLVIALVTPLSWPLAADAQQRAKVPRVAIVITTSPLADVVGPEPATAT